MKYGSTGKILHVDLSQNKINVEEFDEEFFRSYPGGKALASYLLLRDIPPHSDPLGPENVLILAAGLLTGFPLPTSSRFSAAALSPLTGGFGESEAGGFWGPELRKAGFEAIEITGKASRPVYLWVENGNAEIRDAEHLWGLDPDQVQVAIREEQDDQQIRILQIGLGGENQVRYACLTNELRHFNGRSGMGAVMGSKNLKAIAVRGKQPILDLAHDKQSLLAIGHKLSKQLKDHPLSWDLHEKGTQGIPAGLNASGILPTRNFREGAFEGIDNIKWEAYSKELLTARQTCYACAVRCKPEIAVDDRYKVSKLYGGPEYESVASLGSNCGIDDIQAIAKANELCNRYTLDVISTGVSIAFAMECFEHQLISLDQTGGLDLKFGNAEAMLQMIELIAHRQGLGALLAEGVARATEVIGGDSYFFAMHVKGQELPLHDPRGKTGVGLGYAVSDNGADHINTIHDTSVQNPESIGFKGAAELGLTKAVSSRDLSSEKVNQFFLFERWVSLEKVLGLCYFGPVPRAFIHVQDVIDLVKAATGWSLNLQGLLEIGERALALGRVFNIREGFSRQDDRLPERLFTPLEAGALTGVSISQPDFEQALLELYKIKGWNLDSGAPSRDRLVKLGIDWAADLIGSD